MDIMTDDAERMARAQGWSDASVGSLALAFLRSQDTDTQAAFVAYLRDVQATENGNFDGGSDPAPLTTHRNNGRKPVPADVATIARAVAVFIGTTVEDLTICDHTHEELSPGAYTIAYEGGMYDWPYLFTQFDFGGRFTTPEGWHLEAGTGWYLAVYPER